MTKYLVRQYRPAYFSGFTNQVSSGVEYDQITKVPWLEQREDEPLVLEHGSMKSDELFIMRNCRDGKRWVMGFALPEDSNEMSPNGDLLRDNWRYKEHES